MNINTHNATHQTTKKKTQTLNITQKQKHKKGTSNNEKKKQTTHVNNTHTQKSTRTPPKTI